MPKWDRLSIRKMLLQKRSFVQCFSRAAIVSVANCIKVLHNYMKRNTILQSFAI